MSSAINCVAAIAPRFSSQAREPALWTMRDGVVTFGELGALAARVQTAAWAEGLRPREPVLLLASPGPDLFGAMLGLLGLGVPVMFVEPWMPVAKVEHVVRLARPSAFIAGLPGQLWGLRVRAVREIPRWFNISELRGEPVSGPFAVDRVEPDAAAAITFTSGTTGQPKGVVRTHRYMRDLLGILAAGAAGSELPGPDLCVLPNLALYNLAMGRASLLVPHDWSDRSLGAIASLQSDLQPHSLVSGPGFLRRLLAFTAASADFGSLRSVAIGGATADCSLLEKGFERWADASWMHVYGGTEVEPVTRADARHCVRESRARGLFQVLHLGGPIPELATRVSADGLCVSGPNVAAPFIPSDGGSGGAGNNDVTGHERWHCMGDRIVADDAGWWFGGRVSQPAGLFELEQRIYSFLGTSDCFVHRGRDGRLVLYGERLRSRSRQRGTTIEKAFPEVSEVRHLRILRDRRHRARLDRARSLARGGYDER